MKRALLLFAILLTSLLLMAVSGCGGTENATQTSSATASSATASAQVAMTSTTLVSTTAGMAAAPTTDAAQSSPQPGFESWVVYINDDDSYTDGGITYSIALNLTATNPTQEIAGTYTGSATAKTDSKGEYQGQTLNASAIVNSTKLEFELAEGFDSGGGQIAPVTPDNLVYSGSGTIVMQAAGSGSYGQAGGAFSNTSGQAIEVSTKGSAVTLTVVISGHKFIFEGTLSGV